MPSYLTADLRKRFESFLNQIKIRRWRGYRTAFELVRGSETVVVELEFEDLMATASVDIIEWMVESVVYVWTVISPPAVYRPKKRRFRKRLREAANLYRSGF